MTRHQRLRRVLILCHHCLDNIAYYRAGKPGPTPAFDPASNFWVTANGNFLDMAVLAWCKLFANKEEHAWKQILLPASHPDFEKGLLAAVGMTAPEWDTYLLSMRTYRDKFLAHLDSEEIMHIPRLDPAVAATIFYGDHLVATESTLGVLSKPDVDFRARHREQEAARAYREQGRQDFVK